MNAFNISTRPINRANIGSGIQRQTISDIEVEEHSAGLFVLAAIGFVLAGDLPRFVRDLHRVAERLR